MTTCVEQEGKGGMRKIAVANRKGEVGKTTSAVHLAPEVLDLISNLELDSTPRTVTT